MVKLLKVVESFLVCTVLKFSSHGLQEFTSVGAHLSLRLVSLMYSTETWLFHTIHDHMVFTVCRKTYNQEGEVS